MSPLLSHGITNKWPTFWQFENGCLDAHYDTYEACQLVTVSSFAGGQTLLVCSNNTPHFKRWSFTLSNRPKERLFHLSFDTLRVASQTTKNLWKIDLQNYVCCLYKKNNSRRESFHKWSGATLRLYRQILTLRSTRIFVPRCYTAPRLPENPGMAGRCFWPLNLIVLQNSIYPIPVWPLVHSDFDSGFQ